MKTDVLKTLFGFDKGKMKLSTEIAAGLTTFFAMSYILAVNPSILSSTGMDKNALFTATALSAAFSTLLVAFIARMPLGLAPGMGLNAFFAFTVCGAMGYDWKFALTAVFIEGVIFILLALSGFWKILVDAIPVSMRKAITVGIGLFITFLGLKSGGVVMDDPATFITLGDITHGAGLLSVIGIVITGILLILGVPGALLIGIILTSLIGIPMNLTVFNGVAGLPPSVEPVFLKFDLSPSKVFSVDMFVVVATFLFVDLFDTIGTLLGVCSKAHFQDENGNVPGMNRAFLTGALGATLGAALGTSTVATCVESSAGVAQGGRSGLTSLTIAACFGLALFLSPVFLAIPASAICPSLVVVGLMMMSSVAEIDLTDYSEAVPAFLCITLMPFTYSISNGILIGLLSYVVLNFFTGKFKKITPVMYVLAVLIILKYLFV